MSRWRMPIVWAWSRASAAWMASRASARNAPGLGSELVPDAAGAEAEAARSPPTPGGSPGSMPGSTATATWPMSSARPPARRRGPGRTGVLADHVGQRGALDVLHRVVVVPRSLPTAKIGTICGWWSWATACVSIAEPLQFQRVERRGAGEHLDRDPAPQRDLLGLVDDPHPAASDLPDEAILAQDRVGRQGIAGRRARAAEGRRRPGRRVEELQDVEAPVQRIGDLGVAIEELLRDGLLPAWSSARYSSRRAATRGSSPEEVRVVLEPIAVGAHRDSVFICRSPRARRSGPGPAARCS